MVNRRTDTSTDLDNGENMEGGRLKTTSGDNNENMKGDGSKQAGVNEKKHKGIMVENTQG